MAESKRLSLGTKLGFGVCDVGGNLFVTVLGFYLLNFITDNLLLGAGLAGTALLVGKIWDGVIDPFIGTPHRPHAQPPGPAPPVDARGRRSRSSS